jgi:uncharacterized protein YbcV (DUF1398 family)
MQSEIQSVIQSTFDSSNQGRIHFGQVIGQLDAVHVEAYHVDYRAGRSTYYLPDDKTVDCAFAPAGTSIARRFDGDVISSAIRGAQQGTVMYPEFKRLSQSGGCVGYTVWITGRHVTYYGRNGETHVERFPD